jgi:hypothetical protein
MHIEEMSRSTASGAMFALVFSIAPESEEHLLEEMTQFKAAVLDWISQRGKACAMLMVTFTSDPDTFPYIRQLLDGIYHQEPELSEVLQALNVQVALLGAPSGPIEYTLGSRADA